MKIFSLIVLITIVITTVGILVYLVALPGQTAAARNHPYADAVRVAGWASLLSGGLLWPAVLVWAYASTPERIAPANGRSGETPTGQMG